MENAEIAEALEVPDIDGPFADPQQDIAVEETGVATWHQSWSRYRLSREKASSGSKGILRENCASSRSVVSS
jgi:hypothetical protein